MAENSVVLYENDELFDVITDARRDNYSFTLKSYMKKKLASFHKSIHSIKKLNN